MDNVDANSQHSINATTELLGKPKGVFGVIGFEIRLILLIQFLHLLLWVTPKNDTITTLLLRDITVRIGEINE